MRILTALVISVVAASSLTGCCTLFPGVYGKYERCMDPNRYDSGWTHEGEVAPPKCTGEVLRAAEVNAPCDAAKGLHGVVRWHPKPFDCGMQMVWGCSTLGKTYVKVDVALPPSGHAADSALPEEVAHWVWQRCYPAQQRLEWWEADPLTGKNIYKRDPQFMAWYRNVAVTAMGACQ